MDRVRSLRKDSRGVSQGPKRAWRYRLERRFYRWNFCSGKKRGDGVGKTKRGKGTKIMGLTDGFGLPIAIDTTSASPHEVTLVDDTLDACFLENVPEKLIGDRAYDSDKLDKRLATERGVELIAPHKNNRVKSTTQDGRVLRRYRKRWKVERLFAWLQNFRRLVVRYEYHLKNFLAMVQLGCMLSSFGGFWDDFYYFDHLTPQPSFLTQIHPTNLFPMHILPAPSIIVNQFYLHPSQFAIFHLTFNIPYSIISA